MTVAMEFTMQQLLSSVIMLHFHLLRRPLYPVMCMEQLLFSITALLVTTENVPTSASSTLSLLAEMVWRVTDHFSQTVVKSAMTETL